MVYSFKPLAVLFCSGIWSELLKMQTIDGLPIPKQWLVDLLKLVLQADTEPMSISGKLIAEGKGFLSLIAQLEFQWPVGTSASVPRSLVMKIPTSANLESGLSTDITDKMDLMVSKMVEMSHNNECRLYQRFSLDFPPGREPPVTIAKIYAFESEESQTTEMRYILMENFVGRGKTPDFVKQTLTEAQVRAVVTELARLQAYGISHPDWNNDFKLESFDPEPWKSLPEFAKAMRSRIRAHYSDYLTLSDSEIDSICDKTYEARKRVYINKIPKNLTVMVHGDLWLNNIIFEYDAGNDRITDKLMAIIDWQAIRVGFPTEDFARLLATSVEPELRRQYIGEWLDLYYKELLARLSIGVSPPFTLEEVMNSWKESFTFAAVGFLMHVAVVIGSPKATENCSKEDIRNLVIRIQKNFEDCL